ncbi:MAG TPA: hypothetical protein VE954_41705 [Oligoflexus sp.]|uniref:hypothetical protein n=1 Tax=Oligoflexus sp. TaxID=1971216 RepID=UPI002D6C4666|nr:hypothetical protein [Oligoflexus sp.]HYX39658.1 hypothetical protein [Oligoflexus sp.]
MQPTSDSREIVRERIFLRLKSKLRGKPARFEQLVLEGLESLADVPEDYETDEERELWFENQKLKLLARRERLSGCMKLDETAQLLGVSVNALYMRISRGNLLAFKEGKEHFVPRWQFDLSTDNQLIRGFDQVLAHLKEFDDNSDTFKNKLLWLTRPCERFDSETPIEAMKKGRIHEVMDYLASIGGGHR